MAAGSSLPTTCLKHRSYIREKVILMKIYISLLTFFPELKYTALQTSGVLFTFTFPNWELAVLLCHLLILKLVYYTPHSGTL